MAWFGKRDGRIGKRSWDWQGSLYMEQRESLAKSHPFCVQVSKVPLDGEGNRWIDNVVRASFEQTSEIPDQLSFCHCCCVLGEYCKPLLLLQAKPLCRLSCNSECPSLQALLALCVRFQLSLCWALTASLMALATPTSWISSSCIPSASDLGLKHRQVLSFLKFK